MLPRGLCAKQCIIHAKDLTHLMPLRTVVEHLTRLISLAVHSPTMLETENNI